MRTLTIAALLLMTAVALADDKDPKLDSPSGTTGTTKSDDGARLPATEIDRTGTVHASRAPSTAAPDADLEAILAGWPAKSCEAATAIMERYGVPDEATAHFLVWFNEGAWKRTVVHRDEVAHNFPRPHGDLVEQVIDYQVPVDKIDDLAQLDGSLVVARTRGELSSTCDREEMNFLSLNLAHQVVAGTATVKEARKTYVDHARETLKALSLIKKGQEAELPDYARRFTFDVPSGATADPDAPLRR